MAYVTPICQMHLIWKAKLNERLDMCKGNTASHWGVTVSVTVVPCRRNLSFSSFGGMFRLHMTKLHWLVLFEGWMIKVLNGCQFEGPLLMPTRIFEWPIDHQQE